MREGGLGNRRDQIRVGWRERVLGVTTGSRGHLQNKLETKCNGNSQVIYEGDPS